jgi:hypothetical protein
VIRAAFGALAAALALAAQAASPVAFVADVTGSVNIEGDGKLGFLAELTTGTRLLVGTGATVAIAYAATGTEFALVGPGEFTVTESEVRADKGAKPVRKTVQALSGATVSRVAATATASVRMRGLKPDATAPRTALEFPVDTRVTMLQPLLRWKADASAKGYNVAIVDGAGKGVWKTSTSAPSAKVGVKLAPDTAYKWSVATAQGNLGDGRFETLPADAIAKVQQSHAAAKTFSDRVMHAFLLQDIGAGQEAREAWAELARERPEIPELAALAK